MRDYVFDCLKKAAYVFGHPRTNFGIFLMGITAGIAISTLEMPDDATRVKVSYDDAMPSLMTLFSTYEKMVRDIETKVRNVEELEKMTIEAEHMVEKYNRRQN